MLKFLYELTPVVEREEKRKKKASNVSVIRTHDVSLCLTSSVTNAVLDLQFLPCI